MHISINGEFKAPLSQLIQLQYNKLVSLILQIPIEFQAIKNIEWATGKAGIDNIIAYQIGWGELLLSWYDAGIKGKMPKMPGEGFTTWDYVGLAKHFYQKYKYENLQVQICKFNETVQKIINIVEKEFATNNLDALGVWSWCTLNSGKQWPLSKWITVNTASPYKRANGVIRKFIKTINNKNTASSIKQS